MVRDVGSSPVYKPDESGVPANTSKVVPRSFDRKVAMLAKQFGVKPTDIVYVTQGKDKILFRVKGDDFEGNIYVLPVQSFLGMRRKNNENEAKFAEAILHNLNLDPSDGPEPNLVFLSKISRLFAMPDAKVKEASLEDQIPKLVNECRENGTDPFNKIRSYCLDFVKGLRQLHDAGGTHGDLKLDNLLLFSNGRVKLSDFGKGVLVNDNEPHGLYSGNTRAGPWEARISKPGDVNSAAYNIIKMLEAPFLSESKKSLIADSGGDTARKVPPAHKSRWGIEAYILNNPAFTRAYEDKGSYKGKVLNFCARVRRCSGLVAKDEIEKEHTAVNRYIKVLCDNLKESGQLTQTQADDLKSLLESMTAINPKARPTMQEVERKLTNILGNSPVMNAGAAG